MLGQALDGPVRLRIVEEDAPAEPRAPAATSRSPPSSRRSTPVSEDDLFAQIKEAFDAHEVKESR